MKNMTNVKAWYLGAGLAAMLVFVAGWFLLVSPQQNQASEIQAAVDAKTSNVQTLEMQIAKLKVDSKNLVAIQQQAKELRGHLPSTPSMPALIRDIANQAKSSGAILVGITPAQPAKLVPIPNQANASGDMSLSAPGQVNEIPLTIQITGNYAQVRNFLTDIENLNRSILLTDVDVTRGDTAADASSSKELKATLSGRTFMANAGAFVDPTAALPVPVSGAGTTTAN
jgi:type IV pilus assembly protein PilO